MVGSKTCPTRLLILPNRAITFGASVVGICMICETSRLNGNPSFERTVIVERCLSNWCASVRAEAQFNTRLVVGTNSTRMIYVLKGYFPGPTGSAQTPFCPLL